MATTYRIYPSIGISRVGNSPDGYYYGPETFRGLPTEPATGAPVSKFRDEAGRLKRQAARFHVRAFEDGDTQGRVVGIGGDVADIRWTVHLANKKSAWYEFRQLAGLDGYGADFPRRNAGITDPAARRRELVIDPGPRTVSQAVTTAEFDKLSAPPGYPATFPPDDLAPFGIETLGRLATGGDGTLTVLGGHGSSGFSLSIARQADAGRNWGAPSIQDYANNDGWFDDVSDGPVNATLVMADGSTVEVGVPSWVLVTPPAFAPQIPNVITLWDTIYDVFVRERDLVPALCMSGAFNPDYKPDYRREIAPILESASSIQWLIDMPQYAHYPLQNPLLGEPKGADPKARRQMVLDAVRPPGDPNAARNANGRPLMPYQAGDDPFAQGADKTYPGPRYATVTETQYFLLRQWLNGTFTDPPPGGPAEPPGQALDKAVLGNCVGGPFCPGIEITWIARKLWIYSEPFRIRHAPVNGTLSLEDREADGCEPGDLSKRMAQPWQADFNECSDQEVPPDDMTVYWWPAQRPMSVSLADHSRAAWDRGIPRNGEKTYAGDLAMVTLWKALGFVINEGTEAQPNFMEVERDEGAFPPGV